MLGKLLDTKRMDFVKRIKEYMLITSVHGVKYVADAKGLFIEKLFWIVVIAGSIFGMYILMSESYKAYHETAVSFVTETSYVHWNTTFPAVTVCELKNNLKIEFYLDQIYGDVEDATLDLLVPDLVYYSGKCFACTQCSDKDCLFGKTIENLTSTMRANCSLLVFGCSWNDVEFDCCSQFLPLETEYGTCYSINSMQTITTTDKMKLIGNLDEGPGMLKFKSMETINVFLHSPEDVPNFNSPIDEKLTVEYEDQLLVTFQVTEIVNDPKLQEIPIEKRHCRFFDENDLTVYRYYSYSACVVQCHAQGEMDKCGCVSYFMPERNASSWPSCDIKGLACLTNHHDTVHRVKNEWTSSAGLVCDCLPSCTEPEYNIFIDKLEESDREFQPGEESKVTIRLAHLPHSRFKRNVVRTSLDLVVSMGGALGLCLGASLLSIVELVYYCLFRRQGDRKPTSEVINVSKKEESIRRKSSFSTLGSRQFRNYFPNDYGRIKY